MSDTDTERATLEVVCTKADHTIKSLLAQQPAGAGKNWYDQDAMFGVLLAQCL